MPFKNKRNSRDDKSEKSNRTTGPSPKSNSFKPEKTEGISNFKKKLYSDDSRKSFKGGPKKSEERQDSGISSERRSPRRFSSSSQERPEKKTFRERSQHDVASRGKAKFSEGAERKSFGDKPNSERKPFSGSKGIDKKPYPGRDNKFTDKKAPKRFNDKPFKSRAGSDNSGSERPKF